MPRIDEPAKFWSCLESAVRNALSGRPGPSVLLIPRDLFDCEVGPRPSGLPDRLDDLIIPRAAKLGRSSDLFDAIRAASAPVMLMGSGVDRCSNPAAVVKFARRMGMRVATTLSNKNSFPNDDPLYLGMVGVAGEPSAHRFLQEEADLIIAVGTGLNVMTSQPIQQALQPERLAVVNVDMGEVLRIVNPAVFVEADAGVVFVELNQIRDHDRLAPRTVNVSPSTRYVPQLAPDLPPADFGSSPNGLCRSLLQSDALEVLQRFLPTSGHMLFDAGNCAAAALHYLRIPRTVSSTCAWGWVEWDTRSPPLSEPNLALRAIRARWCSAATEHS